MIQILNVTSTMFRMLLGTQEFVLPCPILSDSAAPTAAWSFAGWSDQDRVSRLPTDQPGQHLIHQLSRTIDFRALHSSNTRRYPFLLQSTATRPSLGQFDILFAFPGEALILSDLAALSGPGSEGQPDFLSALDRWWRQQHVEETEAPAQRSVEADDATIASFESGYLTRMLASTAKSVSI